LRNAFVPGQGSPRLPKKGVVYPLKEGGTKLGGEHAQTACSSDEREEAVRWFQLGADQGGGVTRVQFKTGKLGEKKGGLSRLLDSKRMQRWGVQGGMFISVTEPTSNMGEYVILQRKRDGKKNRKN